MIISQLSSSLLFLPQIEEYDITLGLSPVTQVISYGSSMTKSIKDVIYIELTNSIVKQTNNVVTYNSPVGDIVTYTNLSPNILTVNDSGQTTYVSNGSGSVNVNSKLKKRTRRIEVPTYQTPITNTKVYLSFVTSSLAYNISSSVVQMVAGLTSSTTTYNLYSSVNDTSKVYTRNGNLFCKDINLTCIPVSRDGHQLGKGCLVSKNILLTAAHVGGGSSYTFVDNNNNIVTRSVLATTNISNSDIIVVKLQDVTGSIRPCKVAYIPNSKLTVEANNTKHLLSIYTNQFREMHICNIVLNQYANHDYIYYNNSLSEWYKSIITGDSGNPYFLIASGEAYLAGTWHTSYGGSSVGQFFSDINAAIQSMGSSDLLITSSFSTFTSY